MEIGRYLQNRLIRIGLALLILGAGPLLAINVLAAVGIWPDPNPNPVGPGILAALTFWPGIISVWWWGWCGCRGVTSTVTLSAARGRSTVP